MPLPHETLAGLADSRTASRLWAKDPSVFSAAQDPDARKSILNRLGWLDAPESMAAHLAEIERVAASVLRDGLTHVCLLGMGGSSLCAEVLRLTLASPEMQHRVLVLDTTDERAVRTVTDSVVPAHTLFIVASKSGSTVEVTALESFFRAWVTEAVGARVGEHFVAITDPGTSLVAHAAANKYRHTFINPADIGGRYSALSLFGLVSAAMMNIEPARLLAPAIAMAKACREDSPANPGLALGAFMATHAKTGRDKLTLLLPASLSALGIWIEQLVAESTGKRDISGNETGVLPIVDEPEARIEDFGSDRAFVQVTAREDQVAADVRASLIAAGHPVFHIEATADDLGAEFFRWEFATAIAGAMLDVNPFDEPNVRDAKTRTVDILDGPRPLTVSPALSEQDGLLSRSHRPADSPAPGPGTFVAILDYLPVDQRRTAAVSRVRGHIRSVIGAATTHGLGPRYLHSTGQFHKGGTNSGFFLLLTAADASDTPVPGANYSFSVLKHAQALGDFEALCANGRHVVHVHIADPYADFSAEMEKIVTRLISA